MPLPQAQTLRPAGTINGPEAWKQTHKTRKKAPNPMPKEIVGLSENPVLKHPAQKGIV